MILMRLMLEFVLNPGVAHVACCVDDFSLRANDKAGR